MAMKPIFSTIALAVVFLVVTSAPDAVAADRHAGYYYPPAQTEEEYVARSRTLLNADRHMRLEFVNTVTAEQYGQTYPPQYAMFAKGEEGEKMIIVSLYEGAFDTLYRARGLLAMLSAVARRTPFFREHKVEDIFTFFDLLKLLGYSQLTISDGRSFSHRVLIK
ncbi:MAG: molybdopterin-guanine dinucleotide biosynthesis protein A [Alphaproteobacteria bacterium]|nr:molybdopterin-guanine dinucleotide biosynthesis protein A [Alphaproteobacteria bacterium]